MGSQNGLDHHSHLTPGYLKPLIWAHGRSALNPQALLELRRAALTEVPVLSEIREANHLLLTKRAAKWSSEPRFERFKGNPQEMAHDFEPPQFFERSPPHVLDAQPRLSSRTKGGSSGGIPTLQTEPSSNLSDCLQRGSLSCQHHPAKTRLTLAHPKSGLNQTKLGRAGTCQKVAPNKTCPFPLK